MLAPNSLGTAKLSRDSCLLPSRLHSMELALEDNTLLGMEDLTTGTMVEESIPHAGDTLVFAGHTKHFGRTCDGTEPRSAYLSQGFRSRLVARGTPPLADDSSDDESRPAEDDEEGAVLHKLRIHAHAYTPRYMDSKYYLSLEQATIFYADAPGLGRYQQLSFAEADVTTAGVHTDKLVQLSDGRIHQVVGHDRTDKVRVQYHLVDLNPSTARVRERLEVLPQSSYGKTWHVVRDRRQGSGGPAKLESPPSRRRKAVHPPDGPPGERVSLPPLVPTVADEPWIKLGMRRGVRAVRVTLGGKEQWGLQTTETIPRGGFIGMITGKLISAERSGGPKALSIDPSYSVVPMRAPDSRVCIAEARPWSAANEPSEAEGEVANARVISFSSASEIMKGAPKSRHVIASALYASSDIEASGAVLFHYSPSSKDEYAPWRDSAGYQVGDAGPTLNHADITADELPCAHLLTSPPVDSFFEP